MKTESEQVFGERELFDAVWSSLLRLFGEYGVSRAGLALIQYSPENRQAIFRCSHITMGLVKAAIVALTETGNGKVALRILRVSGTLKALRSKVGNS